MRLLLFFHSQFNLINEMNINSTLPHKYIILISRLILHSKQIVINFLIIEIRRYSISSHQFKFYHIRSGCYNMYSMTTSGDTFYQSYIDWRFNDFALNLVKIYTHIWRIRRCNIKSYFCLVAFFSDNKSILTVSCDAEYQK